MISEINHEKRITEPLKLSQEILENFKPEFEAQKFVIREMISEKGVHGSARLGEKLHEETSENSVISSKLERN